MAQSKRTILIIDDDLPLLTVLEYCLRSVGYDIILMHDGQECLQLLETYRPDLIISDIMMPNMDGVEMFQLIKERLQDERIPIIIMTAIHRKFWFADLEAEGVIIIHKPFIVDRLIEMIDATLS